jgi:hypothetical protein
LVGLHLLTAMECVKYPAACRLHRSRAKLPLRKKKKRAKLPETPMDQREV